MFQKLKSHILNLTIFLFPLFFLPITQEYFATNKLYLLTFSALLLLLISAIELAISKKIALPREISEFVPLLFVFSVILSISVRSSNKVQASLNSNLGIVSIASLFIIFFYLRRSNMDIVKMLSTSSLIVSLLAIFNFFQANPLFLTLGTQLDLAIFLGFVITLQVVQLIPKQSPLKLNLLILTINLLALIITINALIKVGIGNLPPLRYSWYAAVEILKNPLTAMFGVGVDNYSSIFTKVKDSLYNQSKLWQIASFNVSRSAFLHVLTEVGILGGFSFLLLFIISLKKTFTHNKLAAIPLLYLFVIFMLFPPSLPLFFLLFIASLYEIRLDTDVSHSSGSLPTSVGTSQVVRNRYLRLIATTGLISFVALATYLLVRSYLAEYFFKKSINALASNNAKALYDNQRQAIILNPFIERFRINFSQTNLIIANNLASSVNPQSPQSPSSPQLNSQDRANIAQAMQAAINEAKAAVTLNPQRATNWENLAVIYRNIINAAQGADSWTISAYQRAILLDPQNPQYRLSLGGIYYSLANYIEAIKYFEQAAALKPDWSNAHYNLAWALYQKREYERAVSSMQTAISLLDKSRDKADLAKAQKDLEEFKKKLPQK